jgi:hypothetical protein
MIYRRSKRAGPEDAVALRLGKTQLFLEATVLSYEATGVEIIQLQIAS